MEMRGSVDSKGARTAAARACVREILANALCAGVHDPFNVLRRRSRSWTGAG
jgi:hypothetical protein